MLKGMPTTFTFALVDLLVEDANLSPGKARKAILRGKVTVNGVVERNPEVRLDVSARIVFYP